MRIADLNRIGEAPEHGMILAYVRDRVIFHEYTCLNEISTELEGKELLELHLFDKNREYRAVMSESHRFKDGRIECIIDFTDDNTYTLRSKIEGSGDMLSTVCHISYDPETGMAYLDNYRLSR